jgi:hypothetical protein
MKINSEKIAKLISDKLLNLQKKFAEKMTTYTAGHSLQSLKAFFIVVCSIAIALSTWTIIDSFKTKGVQYKPRVSHIKFTIPPEGKKEIPVIVSKKEFMRLQNFKRWMDSLRNSRVTVYDSIQRVRPGLLDSLTKIENLYLSNQK